MKRKNVTPDMMRGYMADALLMLMAKKDYANITISEITQKAGVNRSTFYRNFTSKDNIIKYYFNQIIYKLHSKGSSTPPLIEDYFLEIFTHYYKYKKELLLMYKAKITYIILEALNETFSAIRSDTTLENLYATYYHTGGVYNDFLLWFDGEMAQTPAEMAAITCSFYPTSFRPYLWTK